MERFLITVLLSAVAGMGLGGGGLLVVYLTLALGMEQLPAQMLNLLVFLAAASASAAVQQHSGRLPDLRQVFLCTAAAAPGVLLGSILRAALPTEVLRILFGSVLVVTGSIVLIRMYRAHREQIRSRNFPESP